MSDFVKIDKKPYKEIKKKASVPLVLNKERIIFILGLIGVIFLITILVFRNIKPADKKKEEEHRISTQTAPSFISTTSIADLEAPEPEPQKQAGPPVYKTNKIQPPVKESPPEKKKQETKSNKTQPTNRVVKDNNTPTTTPNIEVLYDGSGMRPKMQGLSLYNPDNIGASDSSTSSTTFQTVNQKSRAEIYAETNAQTSKEKFAQIDYEDNAVISAKSTKLPALTVLASTMIEAQLITGVNSDLPGQIKAEVTKNVYSTVDGKNLLIPQKSTLIATYSSQVSQGQTRLQIAWDRLIRPDGYTLDLANMTGTDSQGLAGVGAMVDPHVGNYVLGFGLSAAVSLANAEIINLVPGLNTSQTSLVNSLKTSSNDLADQIIEDSSNIQPTLYIRPGTIVNVFVTRDLQLPPYDQYQPSEIYVRK